VNHYAAAALGLLACQAATACPPNVQTGTLVEHPAVQLAWRTEPATITVGKPFVLWLTVCPSSATLTRVDAQMPAHRHGMNYKPSIQAVSPGQWRAEGLLWHMPGVWEWRFDVQLHDTTHTLRSGVSLP
jgi:hypothetical protein